MRLPTILTLTSDNCEINFDYNQISKDQWKCEATLSSENLECSKIGFGLSERGSMRAAKKELFEYLEQTGHADLLEGLK
ncbi:MAG: hypothetical protein ABSC18_06825 [Verrucomicrobiota bacterium]|jgi:hypothetical protein